MEITEIRKKPNTKDIYEVYVDGVLVCEVREIDLFKFNIYKKRKLNKQELKELLYKLQVAEAKRIAINFVIYRKRTTFEVKEKLKKFDQNIVDTIIAELIKLEYINDKDYIKKYIIGKQKINNWSMNKIKYNLMRKGLSVDDIDITMQELGYDEVEKAEAVVSKILSSNVIPKDYEQLQKIKRYLYGKGFSPETIEKVLSGNEIVREN